ncbi:TusE/DsrC/DsvC family sulfur relay protein [Rhodoblastus sp.]|uniref:TusE/DsrC/DsvC family sulfur relay protein n=1 Tax=Rhodoblastus sp. TaxID=1962975 RepID=UPI003F9769D2
MSNVIHSTAVPEAQHGAHDGDMHFLPPWSEETAREIAAKEGIELTSEHWEVVHLLRNHYRLRGHSLTGTALLRALSEPFAMRGGIKHLYQLFPAGPVSQGSRIAGVPAPPYSRDLSFGSVQ